MNKVEKTVNDLKADIKDLEKEYNKKSKGLDEETKQKLRELVEKTETVINNSIEKISKAIKDLKDDEDLSNLLDKVKAKSKEAIEFTIEKFDEIINNGSKSDVDKLHDDIMNDFEKLKDTEFFKNTTVLIKTGYAKLNELLDKPEVKSTINKAKKTTINLAEKGVEGLKKVLVVEEETKKTTKAKTTKAKTKPTKKKATKSTTKKKTTKTETKEKAA